MRFAVLCQSILSMSLSAAIVVAQPPGNLTPDDTAPGDNPVTIKADDPAKLAEGAFAKFVASARLEKGDKVFWSVYPDPVRRDATGAVLYVSGVKGTEYRIECRIVNLKEGDARYDEGVVRFTFGGTKPPPGPTPTPTPTSTKYYFAVVRPDGAVAPEFTKLMADPGWTQLKAAGHTVKAFAHADAARLGIETGPTPLPAVVTLVVAADGKSSMIARPPVAIPANWGTTDILKLQELK